MILKINNRALSIDVSMSTELTEKFGTTHATIPAGFIATFKLKPPDEDDPIELVHLEDKYESEYKIHYSLITSINGESGFTSNLDVFNKINQELFGL